MKTNTLVGATFLTLFSIATYAQSSYEEFVQKLQGKTLAESKAIFGTYNLSLSKKEKKIIDNIPWDVYTYPAKGFSLKYYPDEECACGYLTVQPSSTIKLNKQLSLQTIKTVKQLIDALGKPEQMRIINKQNAFWVEVDYSMAGTRFSFQFKPQPPIDKTKDCFTIDDPLYPQIAASVLHQIIMPVFKAEVGPLVECEL